MLIQLGIREILTLVHMGIGGASWYSVGSRDVKSIHTEGGRNKLLRSNRVGRKELGMSIVRNLDLLWLCKQWLSDF